MDRTTEAEIQAGRERAERYAEQARLAAEVGGAPEVVVVTPVQPYEANQVLGEPTPSFIRLENETEEDAEARKNAELAAEAAAKAAADAEATAAAEAAAKTSKKTSAKKDETSVLDDLLKS